MKIIYAVLVPLLLATGACTVKVDSVKESTTSLSSSEQKFVDGVRDRGLTSGESDKEIIAVGTQVCRAIDIASLEEVVTELAKNTDPSDVGFVVATAVINLCPEHTDEAEEFANRYNSDSA